ncbi:hypothetical protein CHARACLAT_027118 [Characodon lateralis]|uniref:Uncharacterized protein n=1 Tax=Characodon lateralis TaxID=208331 RepID=A0ABU7DAE1_9TELE|nr:hypothetical protein [Characodon lateralis]
MSLPYTETGDVSTTALHAHTHTHTHTQSCASSQASLPLRTERINNMMKPNTPAQSAESLKNGDRHYAYPTLTLLLRHNIHIQAKQILSIYYYLLISQIYAVTNKTKLQKQTDFL